MFSYVNLLKIILFAFLISILTLPTYANQSATPQTIRVGIVSLPPFAMTTPTKQYKGILPDIWSTIAEAGKIKFVYIPMSEDANQDIALLEQKKIDVLVAPLTITPSRLKRVDFTIPFYESPMGAIIPAKLDAFNLVQFLFVDSFWFILLSILFAYIIYLNLMWYFERGKINELPLDYSQAMKNAIWDQLLKKGFSFPTTTAGRCIAAFWLLFTALVFSSFNASLASIFTVALEKAYSKQTDIAFYRNKSVIVIEGTMYVLYAKQLNAQIKVAPNLDTAFRMLKNHEGDAILVDLPIAQYFLRQQKDTKKFVASQIMPSNFMLSFAVNKDETILRDTINNYLAVIQANLHLQYMCSKYLTKDQVIHCLA